MANGWIKVYRETLEKNIFQDAYTFQVFMYLLLKATYKESKVKVGNRNIELQPGQLLYGRKSVSQKLGMGEGKLRGIMKYLVDNGSITIDAHSRYSIVTIVNWMEYQRGSEPEFPFDIDFLDDEDGNEDDLYVDDWMDDYEDVYAGSEPADNQMQMQSGTDVVQSLSQFSANREPQYNNKNINKYEIIKNKTKENNENNKNIKENKNPENLINIPNIKTSQNIKNLKNIQNSSLNRQNPGTVNESARTSALGTLPRVAGLERSQEMLYSGGAVSKGNVRFDDDDAIDARLLFDVDF